MSTDDEKRNQDIERLRDSACWRGASVDSIDYFPEALVLLTEIDSLRKQLSETEFAIAGDFHLRCNAEIYNRDERIRELEQQRDDNIRRQNAALEECERNLYLQINDLEDKNESLEQQLKTAQERIGELEATNKSGAEWAFGQMDNLKKELKTAQERLAEAERLLHDAPATTSDWRLRRQTYFATHEPRA